MKVSVITPTYQLRQNRLFNLYEIFKQQTYSDLELLILDDSPTPFLFLKDLSDESVTYIHSDKPMTTGAKRNALIEKARGDIIVHFDDDDYYSSNYIEKSVQALGENDFITLSGWYAYLVQNQQFFYWDCEQVKDYHFQVSAQESLEVICTHGISTEEEQEWIMCNQWGFGFSYVYKKSLFPHIQFPDVNFGEDYQFLKQIQQSNYQTKLWSDQEGLILHLIHQNNISRIYPQYVMPNFLVNQIFQLEQDYLQKFCLP